MVGDRIKRVRRSKLITQEGLAVLLNRIDGGTKYSRYVIMNMESGQRKVDVGECEKIALVLGVGTHEILYEKGVNLDAQTKD